MNTLTQRKVRVIPTQKAYDYAQAKMMRNIRTHICINRLLILLILAVMGIFLIAKGIEIIDCMYANHLIDLANQSELGVLYE